MLYSNNFLNELRSTVKEMLLNGNILEINKVKELLDYSNIEFGDFIAPMLKDDCSVSENSNDDLENDLVAIDTETIGNSFEARSLDGKHTFLSNNVVTEKNKNIFYYDGEKVKLDNIIEKEKKDDSLNSEYIYFMTMSDIKKIFDNNLIYEETKGQIITTSDTHVAMITIDSNIMNLNGSEINIGKAPYKKDGQVFIPLDALKGIYELDIKTYENKVAIFSRSKKQEIFKLKSDEKLKSIPSLIGGDIVTVTNKENLILLKRESGFVKGMTEKIDVRIYRGK